MTDDDTGTTTLEDRVAQLETIVQQQAQILDTLLPDDPSRRSVLKAAGLAGVGAFGLGIGTGTQTARAADTSTGTVAANTIETRTIGADSNDLAIQDLQGGFKAVEYQTDASAPGTLELTNAELNAPYRVRIGDQEDFQGLVLAPRTNETDRSVRLQFKQDNGNDTAIFGAVGDVQVKDSAGNFTIIS